MLLPKQIFVVDEVNFADYTLLGKVFLEGNAKQRQAAKIERERTQGSLKTLQDIEQLLQVLMLFPLYVRWYK